jgi:hypothetical protein
MKTCKLFLVLFFTTIFFAPFESLAITELSGSFGYQKNVFGENKKSNIVTRSYSGSVAFYFWTRTAIEFNFFHNREDTTNKSSIPVSGTDIEVREIQNQVTTNVYGIGLRQSLAPRNAIIRPLISLGYAKQYISDVTEYTFFDTGTSEQFKFNDGQTESKDDSIFATFSLELQITRGISLKGSVRSVFRAFEFDRASENLKYTAGFTWMF